MRLIISHGCYVQRLCRAAHMHALAWKHVLFYTTGINK